MFNLDRRNLNRLMRLLRRILRYTLYRWWRYYLPPRVGRNPKPEKGRVLIFPFGTRFDGPGKVIPEEFFPDFCGQLQKEGITSYFPRSIAQLRRLAVGEYAVLYIYNEENKFTDSLEHREIEQNAGVIFNAPKQASIIAKKDDTNRVLSKHGVRMPRMIENADLETTVFSNANDKSHAEVQVLAGGTSLDATRYNTEFIDSRIDYDGELYYSCVRMLCVGRKIVHAYVRARISSEDSPSVHNRNTPLNPKLIEYLQEVLVKKRFHDLADIARNISDCLGLGFWAHDLVIDRHTGDIFVCETNFKLHDYTYVDHVAPISGELPSHNILFSKEFAEMSAKAFLAESRRAGLF